MPESGEYVALRKEILEWQTRRVAVTMNTAAVVGAILGLVTSLGRNFMWTALSSTLLVMLVASMVFALYAADAASRLGAYIKVFHEPTMGWETVSGKLRRSAVHTLNSALALIYLTLGIAVCVVPAAATTHRSQPGYGWIMLTAAASMFVVVVSLLARWSYRSREDYEKLATEIREGTVQNT